MEPTRILFIINQKSGTDNKIDPVMVINKAMEENGFEHIILILTGNDDRQNILDKIDSFRPQIITAAGGDGTINLVASLILGKPYKLGIIPLGSANGLAFELGIPEKIEEALDLIVKGNAKPMDVVRINNDHICLHLSDVGINARIVKEFEKEGKRGFVGYFKHFFKELVRPQKSFRCSVEIDKQVFNHRAYMTIIANASSYRTGANINPKGRKDDGFFEVIILKPHRRWILRSFIGAFTGTLDKQPHIETYECTSAIINIKPRQDLQVDGESLGKSNEVKAVIHKHALKVITEVL